MPSWNIHTAHVERLLRDEGAAALGVRNVDAFLVGNLAPDIYVGYMVPNPTKKIAYRETHFADPGFVPEPRYGEFFERFCTPDAQGHVSDVVLGAWAHLMADNVYNHRNNAFIDAHGILPGEETRVRKQGDFDLFGRTLDISLVPRIDADVVAQCAAFPQYAIEERDVRPTAESLARIVADNAARHVYGTPAYSMLPVDFFATTFDEVHERICRGLKAYAAGDPAWGVPQPW